MLVVIFAVLSSHKAGWVGCCVLVQLAEDLQFYQFRCFGVLFPRFGTPMVVEMGGISLFWNANLLFWSPQIRVIGTTMRYETPWYPRFGTIFHCFGFLAVLEGILIGLERKFTGLARPLGPSADPHPGTSEN